MYNVPVPTFASHCLSSFATGSGPVVRTNVFRDSRNNITSARASITSLTPQSSCYTDGQTRARKFIDQCQHPQRSSVMCHHAHEVIAPNVIRSFRSQPDTRSIVQPQPSSRSLFLRYLQPFASPPDALYPVFATCQPSRCNSSAVIRR